LETIAFCNLNQCSRFVIRNLSVGFGFSWWSKTLLSELYHLGSVGNYVMMIIKLLNVSIMGN